MDKALLAGLGGFTGTLMRYGVGLVVGRMKNGSFPWATLIVNVCGCLVIGILAGISESRGTFNGNARAFLFIGVMGGFTTFSALGHETFQLVRSGQGGTAAWSVGLQIALGLGAVWLGHGLAGGSRVAA